MKKLFPIVPIVIVLSLFLPLSSRAAGDFPAFPMAFYGQATLDGAALPAGSRIEAYDNETMVGEITLGAAGRYGEDAPMGAKLLVGSYAGYRILFKYALPGAAEAPAGLSPASYDHEFSAGQSVALDLKFISDAVAPKVLNGWPSGTLARGINSATISVNTDEVAVCRYAAAPNSDFGAMKDFDGTGSLTHTALIEGLKSGSQYKFYIRCRDQAGNIGSVDYTIAFSVAAASSSGGSGGGSSSGGGNNTAADRTAPGKVAGLRISRSGRTVSVSWTNPSDSDIMGVILARSESAIGADASGKSLLDIDGLVINGLMSAYIDNYADAAKGYYYAVSVYDSSLNYGAPMVVYSPPAVQPNGQTDEAVVVLGEEYDPYAGIKSLYGVDGDTSNDVSLREGGSIWSQNGYIAMAEDSKGIYGRVTVGQAGLSDKAKYSIAYFIQYGTPTTLRLGAGERGGALNSYAAAFGRMPAGAADWQDVVKIANGRWPQARNTAAEEAAKAGFRKIYRKDADMNDAHDNAAVTIMAYGLRPANRNLSSEQAAIRIFKAIYGYAPVSATDWDAVRAIAYSGATR